MLKRLRPSIMVRAADDREDKLALMSGLGYVVTIEGGKKLTWPGEWLGKL